MTSTGATGCRQCSSGYSPNYGASACLQCPADSTTLVSAADTAALCLCIPGILVSTSNWVIEITLFIQRILWEQW